MDSIATQSILNDNMNGFDIIYWINLNTSKNRYNNMVKILKQITINNIRINAVDGNLDPDNIIYGKINNEPQEHRTKIEYACLLSHLETIKTFSESDYTTALILEDDISLDFVKYWDKSIKIIIDNAPNDWEIIMLNYTIDSSNKITQMYTLNNGDIWGAGSYIINKKTAIKLIKSIYVNNKYTLDANKKHTSDNYLFTSVLTYIYKYPYFTYPDDNNSTIHPNNLQGHMNSKKHIIDIWEKYYIEKNKIIINKYINGFDIIYWINMDRSEDRFTNMTNILSVFSVNNIRIPAIDGKNKSDYEIYNNYILPNNIPQKYTTKIEYACLLSHLTTIKQFSESKYEIALIMEDDISMDFIKYWNKPISDVIKNAPQDWDIIMLSYIIGTNIPNLTDYYTLNKNGHIWSTIAYLINKKTAVDFIKSIYKNNKYILNPDIHHTADNYLFSNLKTYVYKYPYFIYPNEYESTIHSSHLNIHMDSKFRLENMLIDNRHMFDNYNKPILDKYINAIDIIYWINLDRSENRFTTMANLLSIFPVNNIRIPAIDGKNKSKQEIYDNYIFPNNTPQQHRTKIEYACLLSHLTTIKQFSESKYETALIMEDDISMDFIKYWNKPIADVIKDAPPDWDIIMLSYMISSNIPNLTKCYTLNENGYIWSAMAYLINKKTAIDFIKSIYINNKYKLKTDKIHTADNYLFSHFKTYVYKYPYFIYPNENDSTIHTSHLTTHMISKNRLANMLIARNIINNYKKDIINKYMNGIDIIYWINLDNNMTEIFDVIPIKYIRIKADMTRSGNIWNKRKSLHLNALDQFSKSNYNTCLILEDGVSLELVSQWNKSFVDILNEAPKDWEIIMLTYQKQQLTQTYTRNIGCTGAYIINKKAAVKFINNKTRYTNIFTSFITYTYKYKYFAYSGNNNVITSVNKTYKYIMIICIGLIIIFLFININNS